MGPGCPAPCPARCPAPRPWLAGSGGATGDWRTADAASRVACGRRRRRAPKAAPAAAPRWGRSPRPVTPKGVAAPWNQLSRKRKLRSVATKGPACSRGAKPRAKGGGPATFASRSPALQGAATAEGGFSGGQARRRSRVDCPPEKCPNGASRGGQPCARIVARRAPARQNGVGAGAPSRPVRWQ